jgi:thioredoxin reductase
MAKWADQVTVLVRAESLADTMSDYLIREIDATPNVDVIYRVQLAGIGTSHLQSLELQDTVSGARRSVSAGALFVLIGSQPRTEWLGRSVARDPWGFILTGLTYQLATPELARPEQDDLPVMSQAAGPGSP